MIRQSSILLAFLLTASLPLLAQEGPPIPKLTSHVMDQAGVLTPDQQAALDGEMQRYEDSTGNQFALVIIPSLEGASLEEYSYRVAEENGLGEEERDNGLLLLVAMDERSIRIEVGRGLEGAITDVTAMLVRENEITPRFRQGNYFEGVRAGLRALMLAAAGEYRAEPKESEPEGIGLMGIVMVIVLIVVISRINRGGRGRRGGMGGSMIPWIIASQTGQWGGTGGGGGFGGSSGGGWSGGGGSFGGGGASGKW